MLATRLRLAAEIDVARTVAPVGTGARDPRLSLRGNEVWRASRTPAGPATVRVCVRGREAEVYAWGPGAEVAVDGVPALLGQDDDPSGFRPDLHPLIALLAREHPLLRLPRSGGVFDALVPAVIAQKVTGAEAGRSFRSLIWTTSERAPGPPTGPALWLPPTPEAVAALAGHRWPLLGLDAKRAATLRAVGAVAERLDRLADLDAEAATIALTAVPGIGVWTAAEVTLASHGDADAVPVGDYHVKNHVAFALAGEPRASDERMLELLEPFRPHRARALRLLAVGGPRAPRRGPRRSLPTHLPVGWSDPGFNGEARDRAPWRGGAGRSRRS